MNRIIYGLIVSLLATSAFAMESPWEKKLPFENATINYTINGLTNGSKILYIKDYGRTTAEYRNTTSTMFGMAQQQKEVNITTPDWVYTIDLLTGTGMKMVNPEKYFIEEFNKLSRNQQKTVIRNTEKMDLSTVEGMSGTLEKNAAKILGYRCDKVGLAGSTLYIISDSDIPLKLETNMMGMKFEELATRIDKGSVPAAKFNLPANVSITDDRQAGQMMRAQAKTTIQDLLAGKRSKMSGAGSGGNDQGGQQQLTPEQVMQMQQMMQMFGGQAR